MRIFNLILIVFTWTGLVHSVHAYDIIIRNAELIRNDSLDALQCYDIAIEQGMIVAIEPAIEATAPTELDARSLIVMPGFIDPHTHLIGLLSNPETNLVEHYLRQGVTTVIVGNDGAGPVEVDGLLKRWTEQGIGLNAGLLVGHGTVRRKVLKMSDRAPTPAQLDEMKTLVQQAMDEGAFGLSSGLFYTPGSYAHTEEVIELARVAAKSGGIYDTHMRDESSYSIGLLASVDESIAIARDAGVHLNISHIKALGVDVWGKSIEVLDRIDAAIREGLSITADQYPYIASNTGLSAALVPRWALVDSGFRTRLEDPDTRSRIMEDMKDNLRRRGGPDSLLLINSHRPEFHTKRLGDIAEEWSLSPIEAALEILLNRDGASVISFNMTTEDVRTFMAHPQVMIGSDGGALLHPRSYGTFPRAMMRHLLPMHAPPTEEPGSHTLTATLAHRLQAKTSGLAARMLGLHNRGAIETGQAADLVLIDPKQFTDHATFEEPQQMSEGVVQLIINGKLAIRDGELTGIRAGKALRRD